MEGLNTMKKFQVDAKLTLITLPLEQRNQRQKCPQKKKSTSPTKRTMSKTEKAKPEKTNPRSYTEKQ